jgi:iron complex outermembrane recepter protein
VTGDIAAYSTLDAQVTFRFPKLKSQVKVGGSDIFNHRYLQYAGGPTIGAIYYAAITIDGLLNK